MVVGIPPEHGHAIERTLHEIEWLAEGFLHQFFHRFWSRSDTDKCRNRILGGARADHLHGLIFARQNGKAHHFLPVHHSLHGGLAVLLQ